MGGEKIERAQQAAIFINEILCRLREVKLFIYGHTADDTYGDDTEVFIYREPGTIVNPYALGSVQSRSNNRDGHAILAVAKRMRKFTPDQGILFVISDGAPAASGYNGMTQAIQKTRQKVLQAQALGFHIIQIAIEEHVPSHKMFDHFVKMTDIKTLPTVLSNYMSRKVDKMIKQTVTF